jgi:DNA-binding transcriptional ArsR family regulator
MSMKQIAARLAALGNETRLEIYRLLVRAGECGMPVTGVQTELGIPGSTLSHHLHKLIQVGLVRQQRQGTTLICHADYSAMTQTFDLFVKECCVVDAACCTQSVAERSDNDQVIEEKENQL